MTTDWPPRWCKVDRDDHRVRGRVEGERKRVVEHGRVGAAVPYHVVGHLSGVRRGDVEERELQAQIVGEVAARRVTVSFPTPTR